MIDVMTSFDPIVWMRLVRAVFFFVAALLMLREPMLCGGRNQSFHRLLAVGFFTVAAYSVSLAVTRYNVITLTGIKDIGGLHLLIMEVMMLLVSIAMCLKLGYDFFEWRELHRLNRAEKICNRECVTKFSI